MTKTTEKPAAKPRRKKQEPAEDSLERILKQVDKHVASRGKHELGVIDDTSAILDLAAKALHQGATKGELTQRIKRIKRTTRELAPISYQALDQMLAYVPDASNREALSEKSRRRAERMHAYYLKGHSLRETGARENPPITGSAVGALFEKHGLERRDRGWRRPVGAKKTPQREPAHLDASVLA